MRFKLRCGECPDRTVISPFDGHTGYLVTDVYFNQEKDQDGRSHLASGQPRYRRQDRFLTTVGDRHHVECPKCGESFDVTAAELHRAAVKVAKHRRREVFLPHDVE